MIQAQCLSWLRVAALTDTRHASGTTPTFAEFGIGRAIFAHGGPAAGTRNVALPNGCDE
jgi:hypothetical protein